MISSINVGFLLLIDTLHLLTHLLTRPYRPIIMPPIVNKPTPTTADSAARIIANAPAASPSAATAGSAAASAASAANPAADLSVAWIKASFAYSDAVFARGERLFFLGNYSLAAEEKDAVRYAFDGNHGNYTLDIKQKNGAYTASCSCPFPHRGCKHGVAALLDMHKRKGRKSVDESRAKKDDEYLTPEEIRNIAIESRKEKAKKEGFVLIPGESFKGEHIVQTSKGVRYRVTLYDPVEGRGHCSCPDFRTNSLDLCKHIIFALGELKKSPDFVDQAKRERFPFVHLAWSSRHENPCCFFEALDDPELEKRLRSLFSDKGIYTRDSMGPLFKLFQESGEESLLRFDDHLLRRMEDIQYRKELSKLAAKSAPDFSFLKAKLYQYQIDGVRYALFRKAAVIADEMGLGKTLQAIATAILKADIFGFTKVLIVSPSSLKEQWKREIEKFTDHRALVIAGSKEQRRRLIEEDGTLFKITNYEALMRDVLVLGRWKPDFIILDEAQRIRNFETKTHQAVLSIPHAHSLVITGTPLENKLEDVYSIAQFSDPTLFTPLWAFAANYFNMDRHGKKVLGYRNLDTIRDKLKDLIIRRRKEDVFSELPEQVENTYYLEMSPEQAEIHQGYMYTLLSILGKKILTPMDIKRIQMTLLSMRMVCDSTYLIDKETNISPKLAELASILKELVVDNQRKAVVFSEWTTMTYLIGKVLSDLEIGFVEFTGKVPTEKRQALVNEFVENEECRVFLSTDSGGVGLNLQNADCIINFDLPWNPAKLNQRIGRVNRIGQKSRTINVVNLVMKDAIEMNVLAAINMKQDLFEAVLDDGADEVDFSSKSKDRFLNSIRCLIGEPEQATSARTSSPEQDESLPHFMNPQVLREDEPEVDLSAEEGQGEDASVQNASAENAAVENAAVPPAAGQAPIAAVAAPPADASDAPNPAAAAANMEAVLNQGLAFLNSLSMMTTGKSILADGSGARVSVDPDTGEVVMRFKMPG